MSLVYIEYNFTVTPKDPATEILIAELGFLGFESFVETDYGVLAYIQKEEWNDKLLANVGILGSEEFDISFEFKEIEQTNWNAEWEKNFNPIQVLDKVYVRAPFHEKSDLDYDIVIEPKMSFGTGHHETTHMMIQHLLDLDLEGKTVLDMGCGTGILAIFAAMKGAHLLDAIDIDEWCYENTLENVQKNNCDNITAYQGDASLLGDKSYDVIIANINRNILLQDLDKYSSCLNEKGTLLLSGFYTEDRKIIEEKCIGLQLEPVNFYVKNNWLSLRFRSH
ncbi:MAG: 50S ribosomal protein L11 methyltransferase [Flavobacteriaceae bacterium]|nr:50S ribosomal protein L11 methyltransferase [Flavobacteriaceae bacterium]|tara:strand:- start:2498 stop:3334 length:837 start_codon:yes stop_codon:yes gene_type:complete